MRIDPLYLIPFASGTVWVLAALTAFPREGRPRTPTEVAFALFASLLGGWAFVDALQLQTTDPYAAGIIVRVAATFSSFSALFLLLFAKWATRGRRFRDAFLVVPVVVGLLLNWMSVVAIVIEPWGPRAVRDVPLFATWFVQAFAFALTALVFLAAGLRVLLKEDRSLALRGVSVIVAGVIGLTLGIPTNIAHGLTGSTLMTPFSSVLIIPGLVLLLPALLAPVSRSRVARALRRVVLSFDRDILSAALVKDDGTVLGMAMQRPRDEQQHDLPEIMVSMQQFLVESPKGPPGGSLSVAVGETTFLFRRASEVTLIVAVRGRDHDFLRAAVDDAFVLLESVPHLLASARRGSIPAMATISVVLRAFVAGAN